MKNVLLKIALVVYLTTMTFAQDQFPGTALNFDGIDNYVQCGDSGSIGITNEMTIEAWIKVSSSFPVNSRVGNIIGKFDHSPNFNFEGHTSGRLRFFWNGGEIDVYATNFDMRDDTWHHVAVTRDSISNQIIFYTDGHINAIYPAGTNVNYQWPLRIGGDFRGNPGIPFNGIIEEVRLWNVARTAQEIRENINLTLSDSESGLVSYWQFNEAAGDTTYDLVGGYNGTLYNMEAADWDTSTVPVGGGNSFTQIVNTTGIFDFTGTNLIMDFTTKTGIDTIVVSKLNIEPNTTPNEYISFNSQYWVVNNFGSDSFTTDLTFNPIEIIKPEDETRPEDLILLNRASNSDSIWFNLREGSAANVSTNTITFDSISTFSQYLIGRRWLSDINAGLIGVKNASIAWGDYDNDNDLDILITGMASSSHPYNPVSRIYRNDPSADGQSRVFNDINAGLTGVRSSSASWGDYDNDGDLDILLSGYSTSGDISKIYRNDAGNFTDINAGLIGFSSGSSIWGDYDNDNDLDILLGRGSNFKIYRNDGPSTGLGYIFTDINAVLPDMDVNFAAWGDYDNDSDLDILVTGRYLATYHNTFLLRNDLGNFTNVGAGLTGACEGSVAWGDYDNDGDLDILLTGYDISIGLNSKIYRNDSGVFTDINASLEPVIGSSATWGDYDNDGDLDVLLNGYTNSIIPISRIYRNDLIANGQPRVFKEIDAGLTDVQYGSTAWGDYDNDGDLDILLSGEEGSSFITKLYRNNSSVANNTPFAPDGLTSVLSNDSLSFSWNKGNDIETPQDGLSYNLVIGNEDYTTLINSPMANINNGNRLIPLIGNVNQVNTWTYPHSYLYSYSQVIPPTYWGVQSIDHSYAGSPFAMDSLNIPISFLNTSNNNVINATDLLSWEVQTGDSVVSYQVQIDDDSSFTNTEVEDTLFVSISGSGYYYSITLESLGPHINFIPGTKYYWRVKPNYTFGLKTTYTKLAPTFWFEFISDIEDEKETAIPKQFALYQNYPNPFNPTTTIKYALPKASEVKIDLYDMLGRKIKTLLIAEKNAGYHNYEFKPNNLASGVYIYWIQAGQFSAKKKLLLMK